MKRLLLIAGALTGAAAAWVTNRLVADDLRRDLESQVD